MAPIVSDSWGACSFEFVSPLHMVLSKHWSWGYMHNNPSIACKVTTTPNPLLEEAAWQAFWDIGVTGLSWMHRHLGVDLPPHRDLFHMLDALVRHLLPTLDDLAVLEVLAKRMVSPTLYDEFLLTSPDVDDLVCEQDRKQWHDFVDGEKNQNDTLNDFRTTWAGRRAKAQGGQRRQSSKGQAKPQFKDSGGRVIRDMEFPKDAITLDQALAMVPHPIHLYCDDKNQRWQAHWKGVGSRSRAWLLHGYNEAFRLALHWCWKGMLAREKLPASACHIKGLVDLAAVAPETLASAVAAVASGSLATIGAAASSTG